MVHSRNLQEKMTIQACHQLGKLIVRARTPGARRPRNGSRQGADARARRRAGSPRRRRPRPLICGLARANFALRELRPPPRRGTRYYSRRLSAALRAPAPPRLSAYSIFFPAVLYIASRVHRRRWCSRLQFGQNPDGTWCFSTWRWMGWRVV